VSAANHDLSLWLDEPSELAPEAIQKQICFSGSVPHLGCGRRRWSEDTFGRRMAPGSGAFLPEFSAKYRFFGRTGPSGLDSRIVKVGAASGGYIGISRNVAGGRSGGLRFIGYGITVKVTTPPH